MSDAIIGPLEERYRLSQAFRNASDQTRVTATHYHIAIANGLGWGFDGMDGVIFALATPLLIKEFGVTLSEWRSGLQVAICVGIAGISSGRGSLTGSGGAACWRSTSRCFR
jgi:MFS transporter, putative metabolite:H+ symporter